jgi:hypothetical protein
LAARLPRIPVRRERSIHWRPEATDGISEDGKMHASDADLPQVSPEGRYANFFQVGHNAFEFVVDFGQLYTEGGAGQTHTRIILGPHYAKELAETLLAAVAEYEKHFGCIRRKE